jgi:hypothetical protein
MTYRKPSPSHFTRKSVYIHNEIHSILKAKQKELAEQGIILTLPETIHHIVVEWDMLQEAEARRDNE